MFDFQLPPLTVGVLYAASIIFVLRIFGVALATVRVLFMMRGMKLLSSTLGFFEVMVYVLAIGVVVNDLSNIWNLLAYCFGFSVGTLVGMGMEERLALGFVNVRVVSPDSAHEVAEAIREAGFGATVSWGYGRDSAVGLVTATVRRKEARAVSELVERVDPDAFVTIDEARTIRRGYMRIARHER